MPKYLLRATYTADGIKGLMKDGGAKRQAAARRLVESLGGTLEAFYFAFGETDVRGDCGHARPCLDCRRLADDRRHRGRHHARSRCCSP